MVAFLVLLFVLWLGFAAIGYAVARRVSPRGSRRRAVGAGVVGGLLLVAPAWLSFCAVMWAQNTARGRRVLARLGLFWDTHAGDVVEVLRLPDPGDCTACHAGAPCPA